MATSSCTWSLEAFGQVGPVVPVVSAIGMEEKEWRRKVRTCVQFLFCFGYTRGIWQGRPGTSSCQMVQMALIKENVKKRDRFFLVFCLFSISMKYGLSYTSSILIQCIGESLPQLQKKPCRRRNVQMCVIWRQCGQMTGWICQRPSFV